MNCASSRPTRSRARRLSRGPDDRGAVAGHRQDRERAGGEEALDREAADAAAHGRSSRPCRSGRSPSAAPRCRRRRGSASCRPSATAHSAACATRPLSSRTVTAAPRRSSRATRSGAASTSEERAQRLGPRQQRAPQQPVLDDVAERLVADLAMVVVHAQRRVALADLDVEDRLGVGSERRPDPDRLEQAPRARRDRRDPAIEGRRHGRGEARALDQQDAQALAGDGAGERQPGQAAADHKEVEAFAHWRSLARPGRAVPCGKGSQKPLRVAY